MQKSIILSNGRELTAILRDDLGSHELEAENIWLDEMVEEYENYFSDKHTIDLTVDDEGACFKVDNDRCEYVLGELWVNGKKI